MNIVTTSYNLSCRRQLFAAWKLCCEQKETNVVQSWAAILSLSLPDHFLTGPAMPRVTRRPRWLWAPTPLSSQTCNLGHVTAYGKKLSHMGQLLFNQANFEIFQASWQWIEFLFPCNFYFHRVWSCIKMKIKNKTMAKLILNLCYKVDGKMCKQLSWLLVK